MNGQSSADVAAAWSRGLLAAKSKIIAGVNAVTVAPTQKAAAAVDKYLSGVQEAVNSGRYVKRLQAVTLADWKDSLINKGMKNLDNGVRQGENKVVKFMDQYLPFIRQASARIQQMPSGGRANAMDRVSANLDALAQFKDSRK